MAIAVDGPMRGRCRSRRCQPDEFGGRRSAVGGSAQWRHAMRPRRCHLKTRCGRPSFGGDVTAVRSATGGRVGGGGGGGGGGDGDGGGFEKQGRTDERCTAMRAGGQCSFS
ncbi:unnamed protein product [Soboliphyme baturini]|uniref:Uncharacterized protein n=1 Tax=Soboliphyme baturini TaxID=241478 RepID=A0A183IUE4_9BILA|nr:unnamed protein product [Soboliphyme baturini]